MLYWLTFLEFVFEVVSVVLSYSCVEYKVVARVLVYLVNRKNTVMVHNSQCSDWLVVVKSVSVNVALNQLYECISSACCTNLSGYCMSFRLGL